MCWIWSKISTWKVFLQIKKHPDDQTQHTFKNIFVMKNVTDFRKTVETGLDPRLQYVYNKHNTTWKVLCTVLRHRSFMYQISHSFAALTGAIYDTSTTPV